MRRSSMGGLGLAMGCLALAVASCDGTRVDEELVRRSGAVTAPSPAVTLAASITTPHLISPLTVTLGSTTSILIGGATKITRLGTALSLITSMGVGGVTAEPDGVLGDVWSTNAVTL